VSIKKTIETGSRNWRTTAIGAVLGLSFVLRAIAFRFDDDPSTVPEWDIAVEAAIGIGIAVLGLLSRDADRSTEESRGGTTDGGG
jgi:hypothetical protein